jgi:ribosomal protein S18 acetylase RimI-like enzyme
MGTMAESNQTSLIERGLATFLRGFSATRSLTHPYPVRQVSPSIWVLSDAPRAKGPARKSEVIVYGAGPEEIRETIRREQIGHHLLCVLLESPANSDTTRDLFKRHRYRFAAGEALFVLPIDQRRDCAAFPVRRVRQRAAAEAIAKAARGRQLLPEHLNEADAPIRLYGAFDNETPVGWASSVRAESRCNWVANLFVRPDYRRRGIGKSLMSAMLDEDASYGVTHSVLLASKTGALLYPHLGYEQHGLLLVFNPPRGDS